MCVIVHKWSRCIGGTVGASPNRDYSGQPAGVAQRIKQLDCAICVTLFSLALHRATGIIQRMKQLDYSFCVTRFSPALQHTGTLYCCTCLFVSGGRRQGGVFVWFQLLSLPLVPCDVTCGACTLNPYRHRGKRTAITVSSRVYLICRRCVGALDVASYDVRAVGGSVSRFRETGGGQSTTVSPRGTRARGNRGSIPEWLWVEAAASSVLFAQY